jgi:electron transfer flavoprotein alpha subunit
MSNKSNEVWVFVEQRNGTPAEVSLELLSKGRKLADNLGGALKAVVIGDGVKGIAVESFKYGTNEVFLIDHPELHNYITIPYSRILNELIKSHLPRVVLFGASVIGRDLAPRVASNTRSGLTADCTELKISDVNYLGSNYSKLLLQIRPAFGGNIIATIISPDVPVQMATVREGVMEKHFSSKSFDIKITDIPYVPQDTDFLMSILKQHREESKINLKTSQIIVAGGYGLGSKENFNLLFELAHILGGEVAGSRAAVDAGFVPHERQVGQTGVTVRPKLYIAVGISGAIQHRAGMQESNKIIAINKDRNAPIFDVSHYAIVGDAIDVIPKFIDAYKNKLK